VTVHDKSEDNLICEVCGECHDPKRVYGEVEICRLCYAGAEYASDMAYLVMGHIRDLLVGGRPDKALEMLNKHLPEKTS